LLLQYEYQLIRKYIIFNITMPAYPHKIKPNPASRHAGPPQLRLPGATAAPATIYKK
jgi:hypothetical protein